jgi:hypothetical protein
MPEYGARSLVEQSYQCLDNHLNYWSFIGTEPHRRVTRQFLETYGTRGDHWTSRRAVEQWIEMEERCWDNAQTIVLDPDVHRIVSEAADSMPESPFDVSLLPTPAGVLMLPNLGSLLNYVSPADEFDGNDMHTAAIAWCVSNHVAVMGDDGPVEQPGVQLWLYAGGEWRSEVAKEKGIELDPQISRVPFHIIDMTPWAGGRTWKGVPMYKSEVNLGWDIDPEDGALLADPHVALVRRFLMALWVFMADEIVALPKQRLPRHLSRRALRARPDLFDGMLRIAHLRKMRYLGADAEGGERPVEWSHRWWRKGHYRTLASGERTYVRPHICGPEDKPLVLKNDIVAVRR